MKYKIFLLFLMLIISAIFIFSFYPYIFSKRIRGEVVGIERVTQPTTLIGGMDKMSASQMYSFAVAIKDKKSGNIYASSSEDRQWAVVQKGQCAEAKLFPYPPWDLEKADTYHGARLIHIYDCPKESPGGSSP